MTEKMLCNFKEGIIIMLDDTLKGITKRKLTVMDDLIYNLKRIRIGILEHQTLHTEGNQVEREVVSLEERSSQIICELGVMKEEWEENYNEVPVKTENTFVRVKSDEPGDTQQDEIISELSENDDKDFKDEVLSVKKGKEIQDDYQQVGSGSETFPGK
ncbi:uncharacterized protein LOC111088284 [Limulus polyphemus]|uniref:Uncharacterized protein LOC111088284 n=1 Tax=Limulus polyphemus TaxID=6850 RepID=A0ABM1TCQ8_LIMPO|nr:uncharacterized protein LOC111088284 [Limulus polyphemus]